MQNVISLKSYQKTVDTPEDLITFKTFSAKHGIALTTLYYQIHKAIKRGAIRTFYRGVNKFSESEALKFLNGVG